MSTVTLDCFQGDFAIHRYFSEKTLVTVVATLWQVHLVDQIQILRAGTSVLM